MSKTPTRDNGPTVYNHWQLSTAKLCNNPKHKPFKLIGPCFLCNPQLHTIHCDFMLDEPDMRALFDALKAGTECAKNRCLRAGITGLYSNDAGLYWCGDHWGEGMLWAEGLLQGYPAGYGVSAGREMWEYNLKSANQEQVLKLLSKYLGGEPADYIQADPAQEQEPARTQPAAQGSPRKQEQPHKPAQVASPVQFNFDDIDIPAPTPTRRATQAKPVAPAQIEELPDDIVLTF